jgi:hypothetical protein
MLVACMVTLLVTEFVHGMKKCIIFKTLYPFFFFARNIVRLYGLWLDV